MARAGPFPRFRGVLGVAAWPAEGVARPAGDAVATPRAPSSLSSAAVAAADRAPVARAGPVPCFRGMLGVAAWPAEAVARPAGAAVATPWAPSSLSSAAVAAAGEAPVARAGSAPAFAACWGSRRGRPRRWRGPPGPRSQPLGRPPRLPPLLWRPPARRPWPVRGPPLLSRRAGGRGVAGRGGGADRRGRGRNPSRALLALLCGCDSPWRCARFLRRGYPPCRRRAGGCSQGRGVARWGCGLRFLRVWGPLPGRGGRACCLGGGGGHLGWFRLLSRRRRPDQHRRLRQPPLLALREGLPRPLRGGGGGGAGPAVVAVVPLGGAIGVCHHCYPGRHAWWQARPSHYLLVHQCRAVGSAVWRSAGGRGGGGGGPAVA